MSHVPTQRETQMVYQLKSRYTGDLDVTMDTSSTILQGQTLFPLGHATNLKSIYKQLVK